MNLVAEHISPDGTFRFIIRRDDEDLSLGFSGYVWHTHADLLAEASGAPEPVAVARFVEDLINDRTVIAVSRVGGVIRDAWVTDDPISELRYKPEEEDIEFRYWSGRRWQAS
jgi:hypothetical protein